MAVAARASWVWYVPGARHHHGRAPALVVARLAPDADPFRAVRDGGFHIQVLQMELLVGDDHVDEMSRLRRQWSATERRLLASGGEVDPGYLGPLVHHHGPGNRDPWCVNPL